MSVYIDLVDTEFLPHSCNWIAGNLIPKFDEKNNYFIEPYLPNEKISIIHLAGGIWKDGVDMRVDENLKISIKCLNGKNLLKSLRFGN